MINALIMYDIDTTSAEGKKRLLQMAQKCESIGVRVQNSVFECEISADKLREVKKFFHSSIDHSTDSIRIYIIGKNYKRKLQTIGLQLFAITDTYVF
jgi:CRISPR-associated protein Cas2